MSMRAFLHAVAAMHQYNRYIANFNNMYVIQLPVKETGSWEQKFLNLGSLLKLIKAFFGQIWMFS